MRLRLDVLVSLAILAAATAACTKVNPHYCADAGQASGFNCLAPHHDGGLDTGDAGDVAETTGDGAPDAIVDTGPEIKPPVCVMDQDCAGADAGTPACGTSDGGAKCVECTSNTHCKGTKPVCDTVAERCVECTGAAGSGTECTADATKSVCNASTQSCVQCLDNSKCAGTKPICDTHACRGCRADTDCGAPGICLDTGACAADAQTVYVDFNGNGCAGADGTSTKPFCNPSDAVAVVNTAKASVIVIKGPASGQLAFDTALTAPVTVIGKNNGAGEAPTIPLGVLTGIKVSTGTVVVRDLSITGGTGSSAKGALVSGSNAVLSLRRVNVDTGTGLGVQADTGASLTMDQCIVKDNAVGGLVVNGAFYTVINSVFANNGYGVKVTAPKANSVFASDTVVGNAGNAATCDTVAPTLIGSIISGVVDSCSLVSSVMTAPVFDTTRPYHLTGHLACPGGAPPMPPVPAYDIDGDPRVSPLDCGADQFH